MVPRRRITPSGTNSLRASSGNAFLSAPSGIDLSGSAPSGTSSSFTASAVVYASGSSAISKDKVPESDDLWAVILLFCGLSASFAFGLFTVIRASQMELELASFLFHHWQELDCGIGTVTVIEARKASGSLRKMIPWAAPSFAISLFLSYFYLGITFLIRRSNFTQWVAGTASVFGLVSATLLAIYHQFIASLVSIVFAAVCLIWQIVWFDSRHLSRAIALQICDISKVSPLLALSGSASAATVVVYGGYLWFLFGLRQLWDTANPSCTKDRYMYPPRFMMVIVLLSLITYWTTQAVSTLAQTLATATTQRHMFNVQPGLIHPSGRKSSMGRVLRLNIGSVCFGAGLLSLSLFLKDLSMGLMQNISLNRTDAFRSSTAALLLSLLLYMNPLYAALDAKINDWAFVIIGLNGTSYWHANTIGVILMSSTGLDLLSKGTGLYQMFLYLPLVIAGIAAISTYLMVTLVPGPILQTSDVLMADVLVAFAFFGGMQVARAVLAPFKGAMCTIWVLMARQPRIFKDHHADIWESLVGLNPSLAEALLKREN
ncbi:hypothetical protein DSL72_002745 [Monilinia vaccinii-corymbosi]|uniref:Protein PNS1 n=1 Tax=Monilinia vaccinii-corymbosi TaxID=61207 RepID=A0A8A3PDK1_9HELO|nr:hypothetical protein DSL72_002745 [Monilinia vaccinii-corymbosi]